MRTSLYRPVLFLWCLVFLAGIPARGDYLLIKDVLSESGGHIESSSYLLDYSTGQVAVGQSEGTNYIETGGFWAWGAWGEVVAVEEQVPERMPGTYGLYQNYPNPFNPETHIRYRLAQAQHLTLTIYNVMGQEVCRLVNQEQAAGEHVVTWNGLDDVGRPVSSGIYFYQLVCGEFHQVRKMLLLK
jgi:hypothetical protein